MCVTYCNSYDVIIGHFEESMQNLVEPFMFTEYNIHMVKIDIIFCSIFAIYTLST